MIEIKNLNLNFDNEPIFKNVDLTIPENKITMIVGPNGTGKTTLFKVLNGEIKTKCHIKNTFKKVFYLPQKIYYMLCLRWIAAPAYGWVSGVSVADGSFNTRLVWT